MSIPITANQFLPIELVFNPNWWYHTAGISFDESFYLDRETRIRNDVTMRRVLYERYGEMGPGEPDPQPRPIIGSMHVAGGFIIPALLGADTAFEKDAAPWTIRANLSAEQIEALERPDFKETWPMKQLIADMDALEAGRLFDLIAELIIQVAGYVRQRTGTCSVSVNRMVYHVDPSLFLHANCTVQMISPDIYRQMLLPVEHTMAEHLQPYGIHHCGDNMHRIAPVYAELPVAFFGVGWGSDVAHCREILPDAFFNLRLDPVRMLQCTPQEIAEDTEQLRRHRAVAAGCRSAGAGGSLLHQYGRWHPRRQHLCHVQSSRTLPALRCVTV